MSILVLLHILTLISIVSVYSEILSIESTKNKGKLKEFYKEEKLFLKLLLFPLLVFIPVLPFIVLNSLFLRYKYLKKPQKPLVFCSYTDPRLDFSGGGKEQKESLPESLNKFFKELDKSLTKFIKKADKTITNFLEDYEQKEETEIESSAGKVFFNSTKKNWNTLYKCDCCEMFSRRYQSVSGSSLDFFNHCQFCGSDETLKALLDPKYDLLEDIQFSEKIPKEKISQHMQQVSDKWFTLEKRKKEFENNKFITEMKIHQIKAYEKLKSEDLSETLSLYERKLEENLREMEEFKDNLLKEM